MSQENPNLLGHRPCKHLRSKEMFYDAGGDAHIDDGTSGIFWCMHSQNCLGPDGLPASDEDCDRNRACFEQ